MATDISNMMSDNVLLIDFSYADQVAFDLTVNFERMLERRIPKADLAHWLDCVALDGGITPGENEIQAIFLYDKNKRISCFTPSEAEKDINGKAFKDNLGEFSMEAYPVAEGVTDMTEFYIETLRVLLNNEKIKNIILVPNAEKYGTSVCSMVKKDGKGKSITILAMQPQIGIGFNQQILGYSLMSALGIRGDEL